MTGRNRVSKLTTVLVALAVLVLLTLLWETFPEECARGTDVPRYCVD